MPATDSPYFAGALVPVHTLTGSPRSSTGSTSVLEWNSNSGSEGFSVRSLDNLHSTLSSPYIPPLSPDSPPSKQPLPVHDQMSASSTSAAPTVDSVTNVTNDTFVDEYRNLLNSLEERLTLQDSVTQWQNHSYRETTGLSHDRPETPSDIELLDDTVQDNQYNITAPSPNCTITSNSSTSAVTAKPSRLSSLFMPPSPKPHVYVPSPSLMSNHNKSESISIAQYFQLKAAKSDEAEQVQPPVDRPSRPISAASCLSYVSTVQPPVDLSLPDRTVEAPLPHQTWHDMIFSYPTKTSSFREPTYSPLFGPTVRDCFPGPHSPSKKLQIESDNDLQVNPFSSKVTPQTNLKGHSPISPATSCQLKDATLKPIKLIIPPSPCLTNFHGRQHPPTARVTFASDFLDEKVSKSINRPVSPPSLQAPSSPYPTSNWNMTAQRTCHRPGPRSNEPRTINIGQASPQSTDSGLAPTPSVSVGWPSPSPLTGSTISGCAIPPSPPAMALRPSCVSDASESNGTPRNVPFIPLSIPSTPSPASPLNGAYGSNQRTPRALPTPRTFGSCYTPRYTGSTLPRDMHLSAGPPTWGPTPRRLRFAPLPPTPSAGPPCTGSTPYIPPLPPYPFYVPHPYQPPAPPPSWYRGTKSCQPWAPHPVFWYSDGSIVFHVCHSFFFFFLFLRR